VRPNYPKRKMADNQEIMEGMMKTMMNKGHSDFNPVEMCQQMQETVNQVTKMAGHQNPEVQAMFEDWSSEVEKEIFPLLLLGIRRVKDVTGTRKM